MNFLYLLYEAGLRFVDREAGYYAAAFSYYAPLALIPLIFFSIAVVGFIYGESYTSQVFASWGSILGSDLLQVIQLAVKNINIEAQNSRLPVVVIIFFFWLYLTAMNVLSDGFHKLWGIKNCGIRGWLIKSVRSLAFFFILQIYLIFLIGLEFFTNTNIFIAKTAISSTVIFLSTMLFFSVLYHYLATKSPSWSGCMVGAAISSLLFVGIKSLVDIYLANTPALNFYGATGLILILLAWVYVLAVLIYYGAAVAGLYDKMKKN